MDGLNFTENSKKMFDEVCNGTPWFVRHFTRNGLVKGLKEKGLDEVTEADMYGVCREVTPPQHLEKTIEILDTYKSPQ
eukprot:CAMPEP_0198153216 /NCGR_PEP_ID=MMETSP1443-20131203/63217_1 /TAXON_ID=186043 /ORGANISM="Entomoneis sp., Strain CCMP2396" /LENGTH=77 /DNA_ID=CAMNT_0043819471 /DNA_START=97 /DNA_END=333 /DNA_ORIENTATION=-